MEMKSDQKESQPCINQNTGMKLAKSRTRYSEAVTPTPGKLELKLLNGKFTNDSVVFSLPVLVYSAVDSAKKNPINVFRKNHDHNAG